MRTLRSLIYLSTLMCTPIFALSMHPRSYPFFDEPMKPDRLHKHFNFRYLDSDNPISSMDDLHGINSEEIGTPRRQSQPRQDATVWNVDDVKTLMASPKVLPDIMLDPENPPEGIPQPKQPDVVLDESEKEMGRFVVVDTPPVRPAPQVYRRPSSFLSASSLNFDTVIATSETPPDFMEELRRIKMAQAQPQVHPEDYDVEEELPESLEDHPPIDVYPATPHGAAPQIVQSSHGPLEVMPYSATTAHDPTQIEEILRRYLESNPQFLEQYINREDSRSDTNRSVQNAVEPSTPLPEETESTLEPADTEEESGESATTLGSDDSDEAIITTTEVATTPEPVTEKVEVPEISVNQSQEMPSGNELKQEMETTAVNVEEKTKRKKKKKQQKSVATTKTPIDL